LRKWSQKRAKLNKSFLERISRWFILLPVGGAVDKAVYRDFAHVLLQGLLGEGRESE
jgi:hypothetical protein